MMDAQKFLEEFGHIATAPQGIERLRELILQLAVCGKLVQQITAEEPAALLLIRLANEQAKRKRKGQKTQEEIDLQDITLPLGWVKTSLGNIGSWGAGATPNRTNSAYYAGTMPWFKSGDLSSDYISIAPEHVSDLALKECSLRLNQPGDVLIAMYGATIGKTSITKVLSTSNQAVCACTPHDGINNRYLLILLRALKTQFISQGAGGAQPNISKEKIVATKIALPPTTEQARIVAKVDELMALCDKLAAQQQLKRQLCQKTRLAALTELTNAAAPDEMQKTWRRIERNLPLLIDNENAANELKLTLNELAIRGAFETWQDDSIADFLNEILQKKTGKRFAKQTAVEEEFALPKGWKWVLLEDLLAGSNSGWSPQCLPGSRSGDEWGVLKVSAVTWGEFRAHENKMLPPALEGMPEFEVQPGNFLLSRANTAELVARSVIVPDNCPPKLMMSDKIIRLEFLDQRLKAWVNLVNNSALARRYYHEKATGTSDSMRNVSRQVIHELPIPLPPLALQEKLLTKLKILESSCDLLAQQLIEAKNITNALAKAAIAAFTGIRTAEKENPLKAPKTELISKLHLANPPGINEHAPLAAILARHQGELGAGDLWQRFGGEIDAFYAQLKLEVGKGWIKEPAPAEMRELGAN